MVTISNSKLLGRSVTAAVGMSALGFACGYFGPICLRPDAGVGPITGFFAAPLGALIGIAAAIHGTVAGRPSRKYTYRVLAVAAVFAAAILLIVVTQ
jgi:hypothetical protein